MIALRLFFLSVFGGALAACGPLPSNPNNQLSPMQIQADEQQLQSAESAMKVAEQSYLGFHYEPQTRECKNSQGNTGHNPGFLGECGALLSFNDSLLAALKKASQTPLNLRGALISISLDGASLNNADLEGAVFTSGASLVQANLSGANLSNAQLSGLNLTNANLDNALLHSTNFADANLSNASLKMAHILEANFDHSKLSSANFQGASLRRSTFEGAELEHVYFCKLHMGSQANRLNVMKAVMAEAKIIQSIEVDADILQHFASLPASMRPNLSECQADGSKE